MTEEENTDEEKEKAHVRKFELTPVSNEKGKTRLTEKIKGNPWMISTFILGLACLILIFVVMGPGITGNVVAGDVAAEKLIDYLNSRGDDEIELIDVEDSGSFYTVNILYQGEKFPVYMTKDGQYFIPSMNKIPTSSSSGSNQQQQTQTPQDVPKSDNPEVELFVMTHCPYGTQAEKGLIPVIKSLNADITIRFVHYFMHAPEETETPIQVCIREEQSDKFIDYLECFLEDGDSDRCLNEVGIDKNALNDCVDKRAEGYYAEDSALSENYGVRGSPALVINGQIISSGRSPAAYLSVICSAFNQEPGECDLELSSETPSSMWGYEAGSPTQAQC